MDGAYYTTVYSTISNKSRTCRRRHARTSYSNNHCIVDQPRSRHGLSPLCLLGVSRRAREKLMNIFHSVCECNGGSGLEASAACIHEATSPQPHPPPLAPIGHMTESWILDSLQPHPIGQSDMRVNGDVKTPIYICSVSSKMI